MVREWAAPARAGSDGAGPGRRAPWAVPAAEAGGRGRGPWAGGRASGRARGRGPWPRAVARGSCQRPSPRISCHIDTPVRHGSHRRVVAARARVRRGRFVLREDQPGPVQHPKRSNPGNVACLTAHPCRSGRKVPGRRHTTSILVPAMKVPGREAPWPRTPRPPRPAPRPATPIRPSAPPRGLAPRAALSPGRTPGGRVPGIASRPPRPVRHGPSRRGGACRGSAGAAVHARSTS